ncbi:protein serine/threonine kinase, putative [Entamoeba invadens IP1]|uniref:Protein serine/threonine kinase, putative n=1 Tax=Entamoeba invadens IP1 TaxID=370355 RepID=A0A0A1UFQ0_ENTIV|nr:protein serine/threonine kinase, putative [Entamoeba invadens IP1]ELP92846.1 protein serine/threonine kinase, putative [Entamoeba invadens IP1]|eukprot:XP_004259617.1 protein serine/threonine kinase, putative [Entamoeba invadens IP1]
MVSFLVILLTVTLVSGYTCECLPSGISYDEGFKAVSGTNNDCTSPLKKYICLSSDFIFTVSNEILLFDYITISKTVSITHINVGWINVKHIQFTENSITNFKNCPFHTNTEFVVNSGATINANIHFSIAGNFKPTSPKLNAPQVLLIDCTYFHLNKGFNGRDNFTVVNPIGNTQCFDMFSMREGQILNSPQHSFTTSMFPFQFTDGYAYLLSNNKLMRFCPNTASINYNVVCRMRGNTYKKEFLYGNSIENYPFEYPHCPCDNATATICSLMFDKENETYDFAGETLTTTTLIVDKNVNWKRLYGVSAITVNNNCILKVDKFWTTIRVDFTYGSCVIPQTNYTTSGLTLFFNNNIKKMSCIGYIIMSIIINKNNRVFALDCEGLINTINTYGNIFVHVTKKVNHIKSVSTTNTLTNEYNVFYFESESISNEVLPNCILMKSFNNTNTCLKCNSKTKLLYGKCTQADVHCVEYNKNDVCIQCTEKYYLNSTHQCVQTKSDCLRQVGTFCVKCDTNYFVENGNCILKSDCLYGERNTCLKCVNGNQIGKCLKCDSTNCEKCDLNICTICKQNYIKNNNSICFKEENTISSGVNSIYCSDNFYMNTSKCLSCNTRDIKWIKCDIQKALLCSENYKTNESGICVSTLCKDNEKKEENGRCVNSNTTCEFTVNKKCVSCALNNHLDNNTCVNTDIHSIEIEKCLQVNIFQCVRCEDNYILNNGKCITCEGNCSTCISTPSFCLTCQNGFYLNNQHECISNEILAEKCEKMSQVINGCYECKNGYFRLVNGLCLPQSNIKGCEVNVTQNGCFKCQDGYYIVNTNECEKCHDNCKTCSLKTTKCTSCIYTRVLQSNEVCYELSQIKKCKQIEDSKCTHCSFWNEPNETGTFCRNKAVWWVILLLVLFTILLLIISIILLCFITRVILRKMSQKSLEKTTTIFAMKRSNVTFFALSNGMCVDRDTLIYTNEINEEEEIRVCHETKGLLCVGNSKNKAVKVQFSSNTNDESYTIRVDPNIITLKRGFACEFSIYLMPKYTTNINSDIAIISKSYESGVEAFNKIKIIAKTETTTRLDPNEIIEEKKIGEGSFGVVYKGSFRGNVVAIKKMKETNIIEKGDDVLDEFTKEVEMLDKFRSEYIVHFYGAVFIPSKVCMVTEFASYGSLQDLMKHKTSSEIDMKMRVKMMLDSAKGMLYLHQNGILHRDIKPDNFLVCSISEKDKVNAKLTDFGSARNVNMLMTNMTFTAGIGTPKYMAPEILKCEKYKETSDMYSFAITMYECFQWTEAYPKTFFNYPWKIAEFVTAGKRLEKPEMIRQELYNIITSCWGQNPRERCSSSEVVEQLKLYLGI